MIDATSIIDYSYDDFCDGITTIVHQVQASGFKPDYIVGVVRGGAVPAVYLSHKLKVPVAMVAWNTRDDTEWGNESNYWIPEDLVAGKKILLVDDIIDGGETIKELLADWQTSVRDMIPVDNLRICCMIHNTAQQVRPHFYHRTIDRNEDKRWVVFPWEA